MDNILETTNTNVATTTAQNNSTTATTTTTGTTDDSATINRLSEISEQFKKLIGTTDASITGYQSQLVKAETDETTKTLANLIELQKQEKKKLQNRLQEIIEHFSITRSFIAKARKNIGSIEGVIQGTPGNSLQSTGIIGQTISANAQLQKNIDYAKLTILQAEALTHSLNAYNRSTKELAETKNLSEVIRTAFFNFGVSALGKVVNIKPSRKLRLQVTGESYLPTTVDIRTQFTAENCLGANDNQIYQNYIDFVTAMLQPSLVLQDATLDGRIKFVEIPVVPAPASVTTETKKPDALDSTVVTTTGEQKSEGTKV